MSTTTIDTVLLAQWVAAEADPADAYTLANGAVIPKHLRSLHDRIALRNADYFRSDEYAAAQLAQDAHEGRDPADAPPDCLVCGADAPCADCAEASDWWADIELPELYESVHEMALHYTATRRENFDA